MLCGAVVECKHMYTQVYTILISLPEKKLLLTVFLI